MGPEPLSRIAPMLEVRGLSKRFGGLAATDRLDFEVCPGEVHAVIGPNGAGKTTLIGQIAGEVRPDAGSILFDRRDVTQLPVHRRALLGLARTYQITEMFRDFTPLESVALARQAHLRHSFRFWSPAAADARLTEPALRALERVGLAEKVGVPVAELAHGEQRQLELAMALVAEPKLLLLDEPAAGLSRVETAKLIELLESLKGQYSILLVEHDMDAVFALADRISVLVYGRRIASGTRDEIRASREVREAYLGDEEEVI